MRRIDASQAERGQASHENHDEKDARYAEEIADHSSHNRRGGIAGVTPRFIDAESGGKPSLSHHAQGDARQRRRDGGRRHTLQNAGKSRRQRPALKEDQSASGDDEANARRDKPTLAPRMIGQRPERSDA